MDNGFSQLGLSPKAIDAVKAAGFTNPTPIQAAAIPIAVGGRDVLGIAQTGTGKTASFVLPMLTRLERGRARARMPRSLILAPTRELAAQVADHFSTLGKDHKLTVALLIGGVSFDDQDRKLDRGADVVIATPGRLLDHFQRGKLLLTGIEILVIDEADRMLDMGFIPDIERICSLLPPARQTLFFSATMPAEIQRLVARFLKSPERVEVAPPATAAHTIVQRFVKAPVDPKGKRSVLRQLIRGQGVKNAIIFCNRKRDVAILHASLVRHGFNAGALHGDMDQHQRTATLDAFRAGSITILAASDVAARGLDIPDVSHVFNYDVPIHSEDYVHRIGRTGRAGKEGHSTTIATAQDAKMVRIIERMIGSEVEWMPLNGAEPTSPEALGRIRVIQEAVAKVDGVGQPLSLWNLAEWLGGADPVNAGAAIEKMLDVVTPTTKRHFIGAKGNALITATTREMSSSQSAVIVDKVEAAIAASG
ncbi:MAG: DEAD/DEAH box helicase, partial [Hyphomicrobiaceae bacterium]